MRLINAVCLFRDESSALDGSERMLQHSTYRQYHELETRTFTGFLHIEFLERGTTRATCLLLVRPGLCGSVGGWLHAGGPGPVTRPGRRGRCKRPEVLVYKQMDDCER